MPGIQVGSGSGLSFAHLPKPPDIADVGNLSFWLGQIGGGLVECNPDDKKCREAAEGIVRVAKVIDAAFGSKIVPDKIDATFVVITLEVIRQQVLDRNVDVKKEYAEALNIVRDWFVAVVDRYGQVS